MKLIPVESTSIGGLGYDPDRRTLDILFRESGEVYRYFDVPVEVFTAFLNAKSKGTYLNQQFKPKNYRYRVIKKIRAES